MPRDLTELGPDQKIFRSAERNTNTRMTSSLSDQQWMTSQPRTQEEISDYYAQQDALFRDSVSTVPENSSLDVYLRVVNSLATQNTQHFFATNIIKPDNVTTIGTLTDLGLYDGTSATIAQSNYYNYQSQPLIAQATVQDTNIGITAATMVPLLGVYETKPIESALELFWETTSNGDIATLNSDIAGNDTESIQHLLNYPPTSEYPGPESILFENLAIGSDATIEFGAYNSKGGALKTTSSATLVSVVNGLGADVTNDYVLVAGSGGGRYKLQTAAKVVSSLNFAPNSRYNVGMENELTVTLRMVSSNTASALVTNLSFNISILNVIPQYVAPTSAATENITTTPTANTSLYTIIATNGSINESRWAEDIEFEITSQTISGGGAAVNFFFLNNQIIDSSNRATIKLYHNGADNTTVVPTGVYDIVVKFRDRPVGPIDFTRTLNFRVTVS